jgi:hypothetical protein
MIAQPLHHCHQEGAEARLLWVHKEIAMKIVAAVLVTLSLLTSVASSANAFDAKTFYEQQDRASS